MSTIARVRARPWIWIHEDGSAEQAVMVGSKRQHLVIPARQLREIADEFHDIADDIDAGILTTDRKARPGSAPEGARQEGRSNAE